MVVVQEAEWNGKPSNGQPEIQENVYQINQFLFIIDASRVGYFTVFDRTDGFFPPF